MNNRNTQIDTAKGLGILLVVLGHNWITLHQRGELFNVIHSFHMPLFLFLSGLFFKTGTSFGKLFVSKSDAILKPYFITLLLFALVLLPFSQLHLFDYTTRMFYGIGATLRSLYGESAGKTGYWVPLWFLTHLFALTLTAWLAGRLCDALHLKLVLRAALTLTLFAGGILALNWAPPGTRTLDEGEAMGLPFSIDLLPITLGYFLLGYWLRERIFAFRPSMPVTVACVVLFVGCHILFNGTMDLNKRHYSEPVITTVESASGIYIVLAMAFLLNQEGLIAKLFANFGEASLFILIFHSFIQTKVYHLIAQRAGDGIMPAVLSFLMGALLPLCAFHCVSRVRLLAWAYMPVSHRLERPLALLKPLPNGRSTGLPFAARQAGNGAVMEPIVRRRRKPD
jgi:fucose 4-O-acetylase-like acetyltransferase